MERIRHLVWRSGRLYFKRRVPKKFQSVDLRNPVWISLKTDSWTEARQRIPHINRELERYWQAKLDARDQDALCSHFAIEEIARSNGFPYISAEELARTGADEIIARVEHLEKTGGWRDETIVKGLLGGSRPPHLTVRGAFKIFLRDQEVAIRKKSPQQHRRWWNPRERAISDFVELVGDKPFDALEREDFLRWREQLQRLILDRRITPDTANKQTSYLCEILRSAARSKRLTEPPFANLRFRSEASEPRGTYTVEFIQNVLLCEGALDGLNPEARRVVFAMVETGLRPSEIVNIETQNIRLDGDIPHVLVTPTERRELKTHTSKREMPLVGVSLMAFQAQPGGWPRYRDREASLSATVNKWLKENGMRPEPKQSLYSLRHSFEDRLTAERADERLRADLMGHGLKRERYGLGHTLDRKAEVLKRMALTPPSSI